jgi:4,5-dihydroxyphthalate decarboxylase
LELIENGDVDAAIFGNDLPDAVWVKSVIPNAEEAGKVSLEKTNITQINHILAVSRGFFEQREDDVKRIMLGFRAARQQLSDDDQRMLPMGQEEMQISVEKLLHSALRQGLIGRKRGFNDIFGRGMNLYQTLSL